jgi:DNA-binding HxlR family transcriptional regulator
MNMIMDLLGHRDYIRVLLAVQRKPLRFSQIQKELGLNPTRVDRALQFLRRGLWIMPHTVPRGKGSVLVEYGLGKRGAAFIESFKKFSVAAERRKVELGPSEVAELQSLYR